MLSQHQKGLTTGELAREFGVDASTIFRDLAILGSMGTGLIKEKRRYILDHRRSLHSIKLSINELLAIYLAVRLLSRHSDEHNPHVVKALEKLADALEPLETWSRDEADVRAAYLEALRMRVMVEAGMVIDNRVLAAVDAG